MGEYAKTYARIKALKCERAKVLKQIKELQERAHELAQEIGECEGYIIELDAMDNTDPQHRGENIDL